MESIPENQEDKIVSEAIEGVEGDASEKNAGAAAIDAVMNTAEIPAAEANPIIDTSTEAPAGEQSDEPIEKNEQDGQSPEAIIKEKVQAQIRESILGLYRADEIWEDARSMDKEAFVSSCAEKMRDACEPLVRLVNKMDDAPSQENREMRLRNGLTGDRSSIQLMARLQAIGDANSNPDDYAKADDEEFGTIKSIEDEEKRRTKLIENAVNGSTVDPSVKQDLENCVEKANIDKMADGLAVVADNLEEVLTAYYEKDKMRGAISKLDALAGIKPKTTE